MATSRLMLRVSRQNTELALLSERCSVQATLLCYALSVCKTRELYSTGLKLNQRTLSTWKTMFNTVGNALYNETESKMSLIHLLTFISLKYFLNIIQPWLYSPTNYQITIEVMSCVVSVGANPASYLLI